MTREDANTRIEKIETISYGSDYGYEGNQICDLIDYIFDDFESMTCENCKYYEYLSKENGKGNRNMPYYICSNENVIMPDADGGWLEPCKDFGCNQWEQKK